MKILLCNDDGYQAPGIVALAQALSAFAEVEVVAPEHNNSAKSNALTLNAPLYVHRAAPGVRYVNGTPADCVHIALTGLLDYRPDLVVSGINNGANMGDDTIYSGTVGAAMEGYLFGVPGIAFSLTEKGWAHLDGAAALAAELVRTLQPAAEAHRRAMADAPPDAAHPGPWLLNVNIPSCRARRSAASRSRAWGAGTPPSPSSPKSTRAARRCTGSVPPVPPRTMRKAPTFTPRGRATSRSRRCRST